MARTTMIGPAPPAPCRMRAAISISMEVASMLAKVATRKIAKPAMSKGLRPRLSDNGP